MLNGPELIQRLLTAGIAGPDQIIPCSDDDIARIQAEAMSSLPSPYVQFLKAAGKGAGRFLRDVDIFYDKMIGLTRLATELLIDWETGLHLPDQAFVFAMRRCEQFLFFIADGTSEDPDIYFYYEGRTEFTKIADSVWIWLDAELRDVEQIFKEFPDMSRRWQQRPDSCQEQ